MYFNSLKPPKRITRRWSRSFSEQRKMESRQGRMPNGDSYHDADNMPINLSPFTDNLNSDLVAFSDDVSSWHEDRISRKMIIAQNIDRYVSTFTIHGLSRIFTGSRSEKILWTILVVAGLIMATIITYGLIIKYFSYNVYTEISSHVTNRYQMPSITFCEGMVLKTRAEYAYCGIGLAHNMDELGLYGNQPCPERKKYIPVNITTHDGYWTNGYFTVIACTSSGVLRDCNSYQYLKTSTLYNNSCFTWNYAGNIFSNLFESSELTFIFDKPHYYFPKPSIVAYIHEPGTENDFSRSINLIPRKTTRLEFDKTIIRRLPSPFPSNCTSDKSGDIFPGIYSRMACLKSRGMIHLFKKCGDVFDFVKDLIPPDIRERYQKENETVLDVHLCLRQVLSSYENEGFDNCPLPCEELDFDINQSALDDIIEETDFPPDYAYSVVVYFPRPGTYKIMEEKELYPWDQIACELGGFVGIALGCSLLSLVEVVICLLLSMIKWMM